MDLINIKSFAWSTGHRLIKSDQILKLRSSQMSAAGVKITTETIAAGLIIDIWQSEFNYR